MTPEQVRANLVLAEVESVAAIGDDAIQAASVWALKDCSARAAEVIEEWSTTLGPDHVHVTRMVVLRRRFVAAIKKKHADGSATSGEVARNLNPSTPTPPDDGSAFAPGSAGIAEAPTCRAPDVRPPARGQEITDATDVVADPDPRTEP